MKILKNLLLIQKQINFKLKKMNNDKNAIKIKLNPPKDKDK